MAARGAGGSPAVRSERFALLRTGLMIESSPFRTRPGASARDCASRLAAAFAFVVAFVFEVEDRRTDRTHACRRTYGWVYLTDLLPRIYFRICLMDLFRMPYSHPP
jgi:hypothetical protein